MNIVAKAVIVLIAILAVLFGVVAVLVAATGLLVWFFAVSAPFGGTSPAVSAILLVLLAIVLGVVTLLLVALTLGLGQRSGLATIVWPFHQSLCPYCFNHIWLGDCEVVSSITKGKKIDGSPGRLTRALHRFWIPSLTGHKYAEELACRQCPQCHNLLPHNLEYMDNEVIAMVGGWSSGKSHYIAALIKQFEKDRVRDRVNCEQFRPLSKEVEDEYAQKYYRPLFQDKVMLPGTQRIRRDEEKPLIPLIYTLVFRSKEDPRRARRVNLILFDGAGEDIQDQHVLAQSLRYIANASAIIFLVDPLALPTLVKQLPKQLRREKLGKDPSQILEEVIGQLQRELGIRPGEKTLPVPIAITLAKSDLMQYVIEDPDSPPLFLQEMAANDGFSRATFDVINKEVKALIECYDGRAILQSSRAFETVGFCAVSATGGAPDENGKFQYVTPRRCTDPLIWVLWQMGVLELD